MAQWSPRSKTVLGLNPASDPSLMSMLFQYLSYIHLYTHLDFYRMNNLPTTTYIREFAKMYIYIFSFLFLFPQLTKEKEHGKLNPRPGKVSLAARTSTKALNSRSLL